MVVDRASPRQNANRERLLDLIRGHRGIHRSGLVRKSGLSWGTVYHHVALLQKHGLIQEFRVNGQSFLLTGDAVGGGIKQALLMPASSRILQVLREGGAASPTLVGRRLGLGEKAVRRHLAALLRDGLVSCDQGYHPRYWSVAGGAGIDPRVPYGPRTSNPPVPVS